MPEYDNSNICLGLTFKFTGFVVIKIFAIELLFQPFLGHHLISHLFSPWHFGAAQLFTAWLFLYISPFFILAYSYYIKVGTYGQLWIFFLYYRSDEISLLWTKFDCFWFLLHNTVTVSNFIAITLWIALCAWNYKVNYIAEISSVNIILSQKHLRCKKRQVQESASCWASVISLWGQEEKLHQLGCVYRTLAYI